MIKHLQEKRVVDRVVCLVQVNDTQEQRHVRFSSHLLLLAGVKHHIKCHRPEWWVGHAMLMPQRFLSLAGGAESRSEDLVEDLIRECYLSDAARNPALGRVLLIAQNVCCMVYRQHCGTFRWGQTSLIIPLNAGSTVVSRLDQSWRRSTWISHV